MGGSKEDAARFLSVVQSDRARGQGHKLQYRQLQTYEGPEGVWEWSAWFEDGEMRSEHPGSTLHSWYILA